MDIGRLLRDTREEARLSQRELARRAATSQARVVAYEKGTASPTVRTVDRLLAAMGLQLRVAVEPLLADVDARVDAMVAGTPNLRLEELTRLSASLSEEQRWWEDEDADEDDACVVARPRWALDGATALAVHGLAVEHPAPAVVLVWEPAAQAWLTRTWVRGLGPGGVRSWWASDREEAREALARGAVCRHGLLAVRLVDDLPPVLHVQLEGACVVPVVPVDEVERSSPAHAEVLARWRRRRGRG